MSKPLAALRGALRLLAGSQAARDVHRASRAASRRPERGVTAFFDLVPPPSADDEAPIFLFSAGWRSGSTLLQRLISSGEGILIWGEAYDRSSLVQSMVNSLAPFSDTWPPPHYLAPPDGEIADVWAANLYPPPDALREAYRDMLITLFAAPARARGAQAWGFKEVRFGLAEARLLQGLFPKARFLFIRRSLEDAYLSYSRFSPRMDWYVHWPDETAFTPYSFARHWSRLTEEFRVAAAETGGIEVVYEDLVGGRTDLDAIERYVGVPLDRGVLDRRIGSGAETGRQRRVTGLDRVLLAAGRRAGGR